MNIVDFYPAVNIALRSRCIQLLRIRKRQMSCGVSAPSKLHRHVVPFRLQKRVGDAILESFLRAPSAGVINVAFTFGFFTEDTIPEISIRQLVLLVLRASNKSATRGRPPVISLNTDSCGIRANGSPTFTAAPSSKLVLYQVETYPSVSGKKISIAICINNLISWT